MSLRDVVGKRIRWLTPVAEVVELPDETTPSATAETPLAAVG